MTDDTTAPEPAPLVHDVPSALSPMVRRIVAANPSMMTGPGTNTYLVGIDEVAVIDPGPADPAHLDAIAGCGGDRIRWIVLTHGHPDHAPGAAELKKATGAEILAHGNLAGVTVDRTLEDGSLVEATEFRLTAVHTPGHSSDHLCYLLNEERTLFTGDHLMQGSTVVISPPDGDMAAYLDSLEKVKAIRPRLRAIAPGHGYMMGVQQEVDVDPVSVVDETIAHRLEREKQVIEALRARGTTTIAALVEDIYVDVPVELHPWAARSVWAHLRKLADEGLATGDDLEGDWSAR